MFRYVICLLLFATCACEQRPELDRSVLPAQTCANADEIRSFLKQGPGLTISSETLYPCKGHDLNFGSDEQYGFRAGYPGRADSAAMRLTLGVYDSTTETTVNDWFSVYRDRNLAFSHTESRDSREYAGYTLLISKIASEHKYPPIYFVTIDVPLLKCFEKAGFCYDRFVFGLYPYFPFGDDRDEMIDLAKRFIDQLGGDNLRVSD